MNKKNKNPELRFKGFTEDWKKIKLGNIADIVGGGTPSTQIKEYWNGEIDWYSPTEIGKEIYANGSVKRITSLGFKNCSAQILPPNKTILFTSRAGIGDAAILCKAGTTNQGFQSLILKEGMNVYFIYSSIPLIKKFCLKNASGSTFLEISGKMLEKMVINLPSTTEQNLIGLFFQNLDKLITLHQKKYDKLIVLKKAMLVKMFPKDGAVVPEIRFKGFGEDWKESTFSKIFNYERPDNYIVKSVEYSNAFKTPVLTANKGFFLGYSNEVNTFKEKCIIFDDFTLDRKYVDFHFMVKSSALKILTLKNESRYNLLFAFNLLNNTKIEIMGHARHYISIVQPTIILVPKINEQIKIGQYFQNLDKQITLQKTQLDKLRNIKKACFAKMFVSQD